MWLLHARYGEAEFFPTLEKELLSLVEGEKNLIANLANISSWIYHSYPRLNWCGFYLWIEEDKELVLGPFQGRPACVRIRPERGVCGASYTQKKVLRIDDVHSFPGHIACDSDSRSELVIPLQREGKVWALLDLDSPELSRFSSEDETQLAGIIHKISLKIF